SHAEDALRRTDHALQFHRFHDQLQPQGVETRRIGAADGHQRRKNIDSVACGINFDRKSQQLGLKGFPPNLNIQIRHRNLLWNLISFWVQKAYPARRYESTSEAAHG